MAATRLSSAIRRTAFALILLVPAGPVITAAEPAEHATVRVMSLNIYGYKTMPQEAATYARLVERHGIDVLAIQEGVNDWQIGLDRPEDYTRAETLHDALGSCWERQYQVFVNHCRGFSLQGNERFDLADGPNAVRTGEKALVSGPAGKFLMFNLHWDHESEPARRSSAEQAARQANRKSHLPVIVLGDFNSSCDGDTVQHMSDEAKLDLAVDGGIDCIFVRGISAHGKVVDAHPSDHPAVLVEIPIEP